MNGNASVASAAERNGPTLAARSTRSPDTREDPTAPTGSPDGGGA